MPIQVLITCEHGGADVPPAYAPFFRGRRKILRSHRGFDLGSLEAAHELANACRAPLHYSETTRLLVDLNRSPRHPRLHAPWIRALPRETRREIIEQYYVPYRCGVERRVERLLARGTLLHISVHSFTPVLDGETRRADIALLYDPARRAEREITGAWLAALRRQRADLMLRRNYPYRGKADGLTTWLRRRFTGFGGHPEGGYRGLELEINQRWPAGGGEAWRRLLGQLVASLRAVRRDLE